MTRCKCELSASDFLRAVSNAYHEVESSVYDQIHSEIATQVQPVLASMLDEIRQSSLPRKLRVLDIGCGTGFASEQLLLRLGSRIESLTCCDLSPEMLERCRRKLQSHPNVSFIQADAESIAGGPETFHLIVTCSVLHHLPNPKNLFNRIQVLLGSGCFYLMLHEPSCRYYRNPECAKVFSKYKVSARRRMLCRYFNPERYWSRLMHAIRRDSKDTLEERTSRLLLVRNIIRRPLTIREVRQMVDIHVPPIHPGTFQLGSSGFDPDEIRGFHSGNLRCIRNISYGFLGTELEAAAPLFWKKRAGELAKKFPLDGAQISALWQKSGSPQQSHIGQIDTQIVVET